MTEVEMDAAAAVVEEVPAVPADEAAATDASPPPPGEGGPERRKKREQEPIPVMTVEDAQAKLKELGKVDKPNESERDEKVAAIYDEIKKHKDRVEAIKLEMDNISQSRTGTKDEFALAKNAMKELRAERDALQEELDRISADRAAAREKVDRHVKTQKNAQSELKYKTGAEIDEAIAKLEKKQQTQSMSLSDEKKLIKEVEALRQSKKLVSQYAGTEDAIKSARETVDSVRKAENDKWAEMKAVKDKMAEQRKVLDEMSKTREAEGNPMGDLINERNGLRDQMSALHDKIKEIRNDYKAAEDAFYNHIREQRKYQAAIRKAEYEARRVQDEDRRKAFEAEEAKKIPYEEEMALCDTLVKYLETTFLKEESEAAAAAAKEAPKAVEDKSEFGGQRLVVRKREESDYLMMGGPKKGKKGGAAAAAPPAKKDAKKANIVHALDTLESFSLLRLSPPNNRAAVPGAVEALKTKKVWYSEQPRGSVPKASTGGSRGGGEKSAATKNEKAPEIMDDSAFPGLPPAKSVPAAAAAPAEESPAAEAAEETAAADGDKAAEAAAATTEELAATEEAAAAPTENGAVEAAA